MKDEIEIQNRIRNILTEEFERRANDATARLPIRCTFNHRQPLDNRKQVGGEVNEHFNRVTKGPHLPVVQTIGLCMYGAEKTGEWPGNICEDAVDAQRCPLFTSKVTREEVQTQLQTEIRDLAWVQQNMPGVHSLLWVLGSEKLDPPPTPEMPALALEPKEDPLGHIKLTWWTRFLLRLLGISRERLLPPGQG